jgi:hypothetical protein
VRLPALLLEQLGEFERKWDPLLGGPVTRGHREIIAYGIARLVMGHGAELEDVLTYFRECVEKWGELGEAPPAAPEGCS